jgi:glycosyltransferase involved in cell wall biosynthesis
MPSPSLKELPPPAAHRTGWPWTEESPRAAKAMADGRAWPLITIVTPTYNHERYLEETLRSVLLQGYPNLEYIVVNDGSTDGTAEIIERYEPFLAGSIRRANRGQSYSINEGLERASPGGWFNWLNSDDILMPGALRTLAEIIAVAGDAQWIAGTGLLMTDDGLLFDVYCPWLSDPTVVGFDVPGFPQDATFVRTDFIRKCGLRLRDDLVNVFDTYFYWQLLEFERPLLTPAVLSAMRMHEAQKTANAERRTREKREALEPFLRQRSVFARLALRLLRTRFHQAGNTFLRLAVQRGLLPSSRKWLSASYDRWEYEWKVEPARFRIP